MVAIPFIPDHLEFFATVTLHQNKIYNATNIQQWMTRLVKVVDMSVLLPAAAISCNDLGNEGISAIVMLKESHSSIHIWNKVEVPYLKLVLYSCREFQGKIPNILDLFDELGARICCWELRNRNHTATPDVLVVDTVNSLIDQGTHYYQ